VQRRDLVVAIDGPSGSGKSSVSRRVAEALDLRYLDTGAMYRAITWLALRDGLDLAAPAELAALADTAALDVTPDPRCPRIVAEGVDVSVEIRGPGVTGAVSTVSAVDGVRRAMLRRQRDIIGSGGIVVEGRDIGTTVVPDAAVKIFLTADSGTRAHRRARQDGNGEVAVTEADLRRRDQVDSTRAASPLAQAPDAVVVDSSTLSLAEVVAVVLDEARTVMTP
jgi:CMP/dCMP kinase